MAEQALKVAKSLASAQGHRRGQLHEEWDDLIAEYDRICCLAPRDHGKTFFYDFAYPIWKIFYGPRVSFLPYHHQPRRLLAVESPTHARGLR